MSEAILSKGTSNNLTIFEKLLRLKVYIILNLDINFCLANYYFLLGIREKYTLLNMSTFVELLFRLRRFIKIFVLNRGSLCFVSFNKLFLSLVKRFANYTGQSYFIGSWVTGFFSKNMPLDFFKYLYAYKKLELELRYNSMPLFLLVSSNDADVFFFESTPLNLPYISLASVQDEFSCFSYPIACETISVGMVYFYLKLCASYIVNSKC